MDPPGWTQMRNIELEKFKLMYYIEYLPGIIARVSNKPALIPINADGSQCQSEDVNILSQIVCNFNDWLNNDHYNEYLSDKLSKLRSLINKQL